MLRFYHSYIIILWLLPGSATLASEALDWNQAVRQTLQNNPELRGITERRRSAEANVRQFEALYYPQINSTFAYSHGQVGNVNPALGTSSSDSYNASLSLAYPIFTGFRNQALIAQAKLRKDLVTLDESVIRSRLNFELKSAFSGLIYAQQALALQNEIIRRRTENLNLVRLRFEGGLENKGSVMLSEAYLREAEFERLQAAQSIQVAQAQLSRILGRDDNSVFRGIGSVPVHQPPAQPDFTVIIRSSLEYSQAQTQESLAKTSVTSAQAGFFPTLSLSGDLGRRGNDWFPDSNVWSVGVAVSYPLFAGGRDVAATESARANLNEALTIRLNLSRDLMVRLKQTHANLITAEERLTVTTGFRDAAQVRAEVARTKYNNGLISFEEWDRIETDLILREQNYLTNQRDRVTAEAAWEQVQGIGVMQ